MTGLTFRARLTLAMVALAVVGGSVLLGVVYLVVLGAFRAEVRAVQTGNAAPPDSQGAPTQIPSLAAPGGPTAAPEDEVGTVTAVQQSVLSTMLVASGVTLGLFALLAGLVAWWLAGRVTSRVAAITRLTREVSGRDLRGRLALTGPHDEIRELGDTIDTMLGRLEEAFQRQERFIANASHELRTPLAATRTALEAPLVQGRFAPEVEPAVRRALAATDRGSRLITALLGLAGTESGPAGQSSSQYLDAIVEEACRRYGDQARPGSAPFRLDAQPTTVLAQSTLLGQAVDNLIGNAVRYSPAATPIDVSVREIVETDPAGAEARLGLLEVSNGGADLSQDEVAQLVEPFHRGRLSRLSGEPGSGLGLTLVDAVARRHQGRLELHPRHGGGLVVRLLIPVGGGPSDG